jgi:hypothetical protein
MDRNSSIVVGLRFEKHMFVGMLEKVLEMKINVLRTYVDALH